MKIKIHAFEGEQTPKQKAATKKWLEKLRDPNSKQAFHRLTDVRADQSCGVGCLMDSLGYARLERPHSVDCFVTKDNDRLFTDDCLALGERETGIPLSSWIAYYGGSPKKITQLNDIIKLTLPELADVIEAFVNGEEGRVFEFPDRE